MHKEDKQRPYMILWVAIQVRTAMDLWYISEQGERETEGGPQRCDSLTKAVEGWHTEFKMDISKENASK